MTLHISERYCCQILYMHDVEQIVMNLPKAKRRSSVCPCNWHIVTAQHHDCAVSEVHITTLMLSSFFDKLRSN